MCGIFGVVAPKGLDPRQVNFLRELLHATTERGTDAWGWRVQYLDGMGGHKIVKGFRDPSISVEAGRPCIVIGNVRAEPTTEWVQEPKESDVHPFYNDHWAVVHNGTIANDKVLEEQGYVKAGSRVDSAILPDLFTQLGWQHAIRGHIIGSYAILALHRDSNTFVAVNNYKPLYYLEQKGVYWFSSQEQYLVTSIPIRRGNRPAPIGPYGGLVWKTKEGFSAFEQPPYNRARNKQALVVCSGGLDSVVAATIAGKARNVTLLHFKYACRAQDNEVRAVEQVAERLGAEALFIDVEGLFRTIAGSTPLLQQEDFAKGEAGAEFAYEWVPARNLIFLSLATAIAEERGIESIVLGNNLEEAGAYPDNEMEFINRFNYLLPYAVGPNKQVAVLQPVGNLMKHQIVKVGVEEGAPLDITWSCYYGGERHCGDCGPCMMRRTAFKMNDLPDPMTYAD
jgi:7-cyano-7-deazaguanine synthase